MPGLIDAHWHAFMTATPQMVLMTADPNYLQLLAARQAEATLMRGFTTVRDLGGPVFGLKRAIDEGACATEGRQGRHQQKTEKSATQTTPKADEKAWFGTR
jgi:imidazolonepropionase-like amidohydrolase